MKVDTRNFERALKRVLQQTSREVPAVLNSTAIEIITTAAKLTKKAEAGAIEQKLSPPFVYKLINSRLAAQGKKGLNNADMSAAARRLIRKRKAAIGYTAFAGWQKALQAVGGRGFGRKSATLGGSAAQGYGSKANPGRLITKMVNTASAIEIYGRGPLQQAINQKTSSMLKHLEDKMRKVAEDFKRA